MEGGAYSLSLFAFGDVGFVFVVATDTDRGAENVEEDDFFRGGQGTCSACLGKDIIRCISWASILS